MRKNLRQKLTILGTFAYTVEDFNILAPDPNASPADPKQITVNIINYFVFFLGVIAVLAIVYAGILFITSGGDAEKTLRARNTLIYAIIGIIIIVLAFAIVRWLQGFGTTVT